MSREIKFKAKRKDNNEWVYGYYSKIKHFLGLKYLHYIIDEKQNYVEIIPETVSQYTGLKDKNGVEIYENDIVQLEYQGEDEDTRPIKIGVINFRETQLCVNTKHLDGFTMRMYTREVIGNKFDNPELLDKDVK